MRGLAWLAFVAACGGDASERTTERFTFVDVAGEAGLDVVVECGDPRRWYIPESNGSGAAWLDYDGDGRIDLFIANGARLRYIDDGKRLEYVTPAPTDRLYRNLGGLRFSDVSLEALPPREPMLVNAIATGDVDNDGDPDVYLASFGRDRLLRNDGGRFVDATAEAGLGCELFGAGAAFGDTDNDGDLDLYVANYVQFDLAAPPLGGQREVLEGVEVAWGPEAENQQGFNVGASDLFYLNEGRGRFREATAECGLELEEPACSYAVVFSDVDRDGWQDILVANDLQPCNLFLNRGGKFEEQGVARGFAFNADGKATGAMGLSIEDFDGDGDQDALRTNLDFEANSLHVNDGQGRFRDRAAELGLATPSMDVLGWGGGFFDADCDGDLDLLIANGHVYPQAQEVQMHPWRMPTQLFENTASEGGAPGFRDVTSASGPGLAEPHSSRGVAFGDADDDGDLDALVVDLDERPRLLENRTPRRGRWIGLRLRGSRSNRDGYGAVVTVSAQSRTWVREMRTTNGLYSSHDPRLYFGLGAAERVDRVEVRWPLGGKSTLENLEVDRHHEVREPAADSR